MNSDRPSAVELIAYLVIGVGVGWLAGLSTAPVIAIIITSLVGSISALIAGAAGLQGSAQRIGIFDTARLRVNPAPLAVLVTGLLLGSSVGIVARSHNWLGVGLESQIRVWTDLGLDRREVVQRYFASASGTASAANPAPSHVDTVLFSAESEECKRLLALRTTELVAELEHSSAPELRRLRDIPALAVSPFALYGALTIACTFEVRPRSQ